MIATKLKFGRFGGIWKHFDLLFNQQISITQNAFDTKSQKFARMIKKCSQNTKLLSNKQYVCI